MTRPFSLILYLVEISGGVDETLEESRKRFSNFGMRASDFKGNLSEFGRFMITTV